MAENGPENAGPQGPTTQTIQQLSTREVSNSTRNAVCDPQHCQGYCNEFTVCVHTYMVAWTGLNTNIDTENRKRDRADSDDEVDATLQPALSIMDSTEAKSTKCSKKLREESAKPTTTTTTDIMEEDQQSQMLPAATQQQPTSHTQDTPAQPKPTVETKPAKQQPKAKRPTMQQAHLNTNTPRTQSYKDILTVNLQKYVRPSTTAATAETILKQMRRVPADYTPNTNTEEEYAATVYVKKPGFKLPIKQLKEHLHTFKLNTNKLLNITYIGEHMVEFITPTQYQETLSQTLKEMFNWEVARLPKTEETKQRVADQAQKRYQWVLANNKDRALPQQTLDALRQLTRTATA